MAIHRCPVCDLTCDEDAPYCTRCGWELSSPLEVGGISAQEEQAYNERLAIARRNWNTLAKQHQEDERQRKAEAAAHETCQAEEQARLRREREKQEQIQDLYTRISATMNTDPQSARRSLDQLRTLNPGDAMIPMYESIIQTAIQLQEPIHRLWDVPSTPSYSHSYSSSRSGRSFWDWVSEIQLPSIQLPRWLWTGLLSGFLGGILLYFLMREAFFSIAGMFGMGGSFFTGMILFLIMGFVIALVMAVRGDI